MKYQISISLALTVLLIVPPSGSANPIWQRYFDAGQDALKGDDTKKATLLFAASLKEARLADTTSIELANSLFALGACALKQKPEEAESYLTECLAVDMKITDEQSAPVGLVHEYMGDIACSKKLWEQAESEYRKAANALESADRNKAYSNVILSKISVVYEQEGKHLEAEALKQTATAAESSAAEDISNYAEWMKKASVRAPEPKRFEEMKGFRVHIPVTTTEGIDKDGHRIITVSGQYPPPNFSSTTSGLLVTPQMAPVEWGSYAADMQRRIARAWFPPRSSETRHMVARFNVAANGELSELKTTQASNTEDFDKTTLKAIENAAPFRRLPDGAIKAEDWQLTFDSSDFSNRVSVARLHENSVVQLFPSRAGDSTNQVDVDFGPYMADLQRRIKGVWFPPKGYENKRVVVIFKVLANGEISNLRIHTSSGFAEADEAALKAVDNAHPFRKLPMGAGKDVEIQFTFDYNVFSGGGNGAFRRF